MNNTTGSSLHGSTLSIGALQEGFVLDHIKAGHAMTIYRYLKLGKLDCTVAIIKNATSNKMGRKDIIKVDCPVDYLDLDVLGFIDHNITVNVIKDGKIIDKKTLSLPIRTRRCDHFRLRYMGTGDARVYSVAKTFEVGSERGTMVARK